MAATIWRSFGALLCTATVCIPEHLTSEAAPVQPLPPNDLLKIPVRGRQSQIHHQISHLRHKGMTQRSGSKLLIVTDQLAIPPVGSLGPFSHSSRGLLKSQGEQLSSATSLSSSTPLACRPREETRQTAVPVCTTLHLHHQLPFFFLKISSKTSPKPVLCACQRWDLS